MSRPDSGALSIGMRRILATAAAVGLALTAAACGADSGGDPVQTQDAAPESQPVETPARQVLTNLPDPATIEQLMTLDAADDWEAALVDLARAEYPDQTAELTDAEIVTIGHDPCMAFGEGATLEDVTASTLAHGVDLEAGGYIVGAGVAIWCAENGVLLQQGA